MVNAGFGQTRRLSFWRLLRSDIELRHARVGLASLGGHRFLLVPPWDSWRWMQTLNLRIVGLPHVEVREEVKFADDVRSKAQLADILWGFGLTLGTVGTILWFQDDPPDAGRNARIKPSKRGHWDTGSAWSGEKEVLKLTLDTFVLVLGGVASCDPTDCSVTRLPDGV